MSDKMYKIRQRLIEDKEQTQLTISGCVTNPYRYATKEIQIKYEDKVLCPFCLSYDIFGHFERVRKQLFKCPICKNQIMLKTLDRVRKMNSKDFADWVFGYRLTGFWNKVYPDVKQWFGKLYNFSYDFYSDFRIEYNKLKGMGYEPNTNIQKDVK